jgi:hypothetical protein
MGLVGTVVGVLTDDYGLDGVQWCMSGPLSNIVRNGMVKDGEMKLAGKGGQTMNRHPP